jgi:3-hydroxybutyryl-CoA dehydrogenase
LSKLKFSNGIGALSSVEVVVEAIRKDLGAKHDLLGRLDQVCDQEPLFLTNTSTLSITELAAGRKRQDRVVEFYVKDRFFLE